MQTAPYNQTRVTGATEVVICATRCALVAVIPEATTTGTVALRDAATVGSGATPVHTAAAGLTQQGKQFADGIRMGVGLTVQLSVGTDAVTAVWAGA